MSLETPRTDALIAEMEATKQDIWQALNGLQGFARRLERELANMSELYAKESHAKMVLMESRIAPEARESIAIPRSTLEAWHGALDAHRSDSSDEAEWNNYGVIEVDDAIIELLREPQRELPCGYCNQVGSHRENCPATWRTIVDASNAAKNESQPEKKP